MFTNVEIFSSSKVMCSVMFTNAESKSLDGWTWLEGTRLSSSFDVFRKNKKKKTKKKETIQRLNQCIIELIKVPLSVVLPVPRALPVQPLLHYAAKVFATREPVPVELSMFKGIGDLFTGLLFIYYYLYYSLWVFVSIQKKLRWFLLLLVTFFTIWKRSYWFWLVVHLNLLIYWFNCYFAGGSIHWYFICWFLSWFILCIITAIKGESHWLVCYLIDDNDFIRSTMIKIKGQLHSFM